MTDTPRPTEINYHQQSRVLEIKFEDGASYNYTAEFLRVYSPSAEVQGHGPGQETLQLGKEDVKIEKIEPVGHYAIQLYFDDNHNTGIYSWDTLRMYGERYDELWQRYLQRCDDAGYERKESS